MKVIISQPMKGKTNSEIKKERESLVKDLESKGYEVVDTIIEDFVEGQGDNYAIKCLSKSIEFMSNIDGVVFMKDWEKSRGCKIEHEIAINYGKFVMEVK